MKEGPKVCVSIVIKNMYQSTNVRLKYVKLRLVVRQWRNKVLKDEELRMEELEDLPVLPECHIWGITISWT